MGQPKNPCQNNDCWANGTQPHVHTEFVQLGYRDSRPRRLNVRSERLWREGTIELCPEWIEVWVN